MLLGGCRKDLCYDHEQHAFSCRLHVVPEWECAWERPHGKNWAEEWSDEFGCEYHELSPAEPQWLCGVNYHESGMRGERHMSGDGGALPLQEGVHALIFYNDDTEYLIFSGLHSYATASATTRTRTRSSYSEAHSEERTVNSPDVLFSAYMPSHRAVPSERAEVLNITMKPLVYTYLVRYRFDTGLKHVALARGALSGMAESVFLADGRTSDDAATILFDCSMDSGGVQARVGSFGVPSFVDGSHIGSRAQRYGLNLEVMLHNGKIKTFEFDITDQVTAQPRGGVITVEGLAIADGEGESSGSGFDVDVKGWGDYEDIVLPM